jgi:hypothetical protein
MAGGVLIFVGLAAVLCRLVDAAISRQSEYAADRFAADHDPATELATALDALYDGGRVAPGRLQRLLATHPPLDRRIAALLAGEDVDHHVEVVVGSPSFSPASSSGDLAIDSGSGDDPVVADLAIDRRSGHP